MGEGRLAVSARARARVVSGEREGEWSAARVKVREVSGAREGEGGQRRA